MIPYSPIVQIKEEQDHEWRKADGESGSQGIEPDVGIALSGFLVVVIVPVAMKSLPVLGALLGRRLPLRRPVGVAVTPVGVAMTPVGVTVTPVGVSMSSG